MNSTETVVITPERLTRFAADLFIAASVPPCDAVEVATSLVAANLCGHESHGVMRVVSYVDAIRTGEIRTNVDLSIVTQTESVVVCDGQAGLGQIQMRRLINLLEPKARNQGLACGTIHHCGHVGRLGEWVDEVAIRNLAGMLSVNDNGVLMCVAPPGGTEPRISTNPIAIGVPTSTDPIVLDISTSVVANGKIRVAQTENRSCPSGWLIDSEGRPTSDPATRFSDPPGTILPMGGYKGFGLGLLFDMLIGGLSGGYCPPAPPGEVELNNVLMIVFDPERFSGLSHFVNQSAGLCDFVKRTRTVDDKTAVRLPHERSRQLTQLRQKEGIPLDSGTWNQLAECAQNLKVPIP